MGLQIAGNTPANIAEVEAANKAVRAVLWPRDYGSLGVYSIAHVSGVMAAGLAADAPIFSMRNAANLAVLTRLMITAGNTSTAFAAGVIKFSAFVARSFTVADTGGGALTITGNNAKLKTGMATTGFGDIRGSATATLTAGTRTKDAQPFSTVLTSIPAVAGTPVLPVPTELWRAYPGDYPLVLGVSEGIVVEATVPATGTWTFGIQAVWEELAAFM